MTDFSCNECRLKHSILIYRMPLAILILLAVSVEFVAAGCRQGSQKTAAAPAALAPAVIEVTTTAATRRSISDTAAITGSLGALNDVVVGIKNAGKLVGVFAREGDHVHAGQVIAQQDTTDINSQIMQAQANLRSSITKLDQAETAYASAVTNLKMTDSTTNSAVDQAKASLRSAQDSLILIRRGARMQELEEAKRTIESAQGDLDSAHADQNQAVADLKRYQGLHDARAISDQQLDQAKTVKVSADARLRSATAKLDSATQAYSLLKEGAQREDINRSQAAVDQADQALQTAQSNRAMVDVRRADVESARSNIDTSKAAVSVSRAQLAISEQALKDSSIRSPIEGVVAERKAEPGMQLAVTKPDVMRIVSLNSIYFDGQLSQSQYAAVRVGQPVSVVVDAVPGKDRIASITRIFPVASVNARSFTVRVAIPNPDGRLRPQMFARGKITLGVHSNAIVVPREAVIELSPEDSMKKTGSVFVVKDKYAKKVPVTIGYSNVTDCEILSGVEVGDKVITIGQAQVRDGDEVKSVDAESAP
jgi:RND family efflux transporter MFP subunit